MTDVLSLVMLVAASIGAMAFGILAAYGILRGICADAAARTAGGGKGAGSGCARGLRADFLLPGGQGRRLPRKNPWASAFTWDAAARPIGRLRQKFQDERA
jgi:hypothetical protein